MARGTWTREALKWLPDLYTPHAILFGRDRTSLTKKEATQRDAAYAADFQVVSYELVRYVDPRGFDLVIIDEVHALKHAQSEQSRLMRVMLAHHRGAVLALTATLFGTEIQNCWNQVDCIWPDWYGKRSRSGGASYRFLEAFCIRHQSEYGVAYSGSKMEEMPRLAKLLEPYVHRATEKDAAAFLPPINADILWQDQKRRPELLAKDWLDEKLNEVSHLALVCYLHETAHKLKAAAEKAGVPVHFITGEVSTEARHRLMDLARSQPRAIIVATSEAIRESIDLSFVDAVLIFEWRTAPASAIQLIGRFARSNRTKAVPVCVRYVAQPGDDARAAVLQRRIEAMNTAAKADAKSELVASIFQPRSLDEATLNSMFEAMLSETHLSLLTEEDDDDT